MSGNSAANTLGNIFNSLRQSASVLWRWEAQIKGAEFEGQVSFVGRPLISLAPGGSMLIGDGVKVNSALRSNPLGCAQPSVLRVLCPQARLVIGRNVGMSAAVICAGNSIEIGEGTIIGSGALIVDNDFHSPGDLWSWKADYGKSSAAVKIGRGAFIGARAIILKGVTIGDRAVIGAGSLVTKDVPDGQFAAGNPAKILVSKDSSS